MTHAPYKKTFIRDWRKHRKLSLRALAYMMDDADGNELVSFTQLGRIESGVQPYSQRILEGIAEALDVTPAILLTHGPDGDETFTASHVHDTIHTIFARMPRHQLNRYPPEEMARLVVLCAKAFNAHQGDPKIIETIIHLFEANPQKAAPLDDIKGTG
jgi:transcriptional regulator with XRE-family HTH domain